MRIKPSDTVTITETKGEFWIRTDHGERYDTPRLQCLALLDPQSVAWLWQDRIPRGKVTLLEGAESSGKTFVALDLAARVSRGQPWPDGPEGPQQAGFVVVVSDRDEIKDTVLPRLKQAGADLENIYLCHDDTTSEPHPEKRYERRWEFPFDFPKLEYAVRSLQARLVVIDTLSDFCATNRDIAEMLRKLHKLASESGAAIIVTSCAAPRRDAKGRVRARTPKSYSTVRCAWCVLEDPDDPELWQFLPTRMNFCRLSEGCAYRIGEGVLAWEKLPAGWATGGADAPALELDELELWLQEELSEGDLPATVVTRNAEECGYTKKMLYRARRRLGVKTRKESFGIFGSWLWSLKDQAERPADAPAETKAGAPRASAPGSDAGPGTESASGTAPANGTLETGVKQPRATKAKNGETRRADGNPLSYDRIRRAVITEILSGTGSDAAPDAAEKPAENGHEKNGRKRKRSARES